MDDTPQHIKDLQLKTWLSKSPEERLLQLLKDNEELYLFWKNGKEELGNFQGKSLKRAEQKQ